VNKYRIVEDSRRFWIEFLGSDGKTWYFLKKSNVPQFFDSLADARSWVATIKRGVVYHDAEDAPNLAQDKRKAEETSWYSVMPTDSQIDISLSGIVAVFKDDKDALTYGSKKYGTRFWVMPHSDPR
jgi:hypothetical protein